MKTRIPALILAAAVLLSLCACAPAAAPSSAPETTRSWRDDLGREVALPEELTRVVPTGPLAQYILFAIAPDLLVGITGRWDSAAEELIGREYLELPYLGQLYSSADLNVEELALAAPQLIIDMGESKSAAAEELDALTHRTSIPAIFLSVTLETMPDTYRKLGALLGREDRGEELARFCEKVYARTLSVMEQVGENRVRALYVTGADGLNVLAAGSYHAELMDLLTENVAVVSDPVSKGTGNAVTMEQIALWDPDFVLFTPDSIYDRAEQLPGWSGITAITRGRYVEIPDAPLNWMGMPPSVQRYLALIWLPAVLYPEHCSYDVQAEVTEFYRLFFGCTLGEEQYASITARAFPEG